MSTYTPTVEEARLVWQEWNGYGGLINRTGPEPTTRADMRAEFDRMIASVERAAAVKALTDAADEEERVSQQYALTADGMRERSEWEDSNRYANYASGHAASAHALRARAEAYRQERGEQ